MAIGWLFYLDREKRERGRGGARERTRKKEGEGWSCSHSWMIWIRKQTNYLKHWILIDRLRDLWWLYITTNRGLWSKVWLKVILGSLEVIRGQNGSLVSRIFSFKHFMMKIEFLTLRVVRRNKIRLQILINPDPAQKDFLDFHFFIQFHSKIFIILKKFQSLRKFYNI